MSLSLNVQSNILNNKETIKAICSILKENIDVIPHHHTDNLSAFTSKLWRH